VNAVQCIRIHDKAGNGEHTIECAFQPCKENRPDVTLQTFHVRAFPTNMTVTPTKNTLPALSQITITVMSVACGLTVSNVYLNQPLLAEIGHAFHANARQAGAVTTLTQIGYTLGILLLVPLGDALERRRLILILLGAVTCALTLASLAPNLIWLATAGLLIGLTTIIPQIVIPLAASLVDADRRGQIVGRVSSGLLIGILGGRVVSGLLGATFGWRPVFAIAAVLMVALALAVANLFPRSRTIATMPYGALMRSLPALLREEPALRQACLFQAMAFGSFTAFWTALPFFLSTPPYHYGAAAAGMFGLVGIGGACAAPLVGKLADRRGPLYANGIAMSLVLLSYLIFRVGGTQLVCLIAGVLLLDVGVQANQVANQTRLFSLRPDARNRLNAVYMVCAYSGGSMGSFLGAWAWTRNGWPGVCAVGLTLLLIALTVYSLAIQAERKRKGDT
jgi:predicted MFS family arabinose efflux permease